AARYIDAVERFAPSESDAGVLASLLDNARTAVERYCAAGERTEVREGLLEAVVSQLHSADAGSDRQLVWARALAAVGRHSDSHRRLAAGLLSGAAAVPGLSVDPELRWALWQALAATGHAAAAELDAELAGDNTASARTGHLTAISAQPVAEVKQHAWQEAVHGTALSNELLSATIEGFREGSPELLDPFTEPYFAAISGVWAERSIELSGRIVRGLYPGAQDLAAVQQPSEHPVVLRTDEWLASNEAAPAALRRIVIEQCDQLTRSLRAQQCVSAG
ncbi:MAG TPA: ERAP1-like C-terminal domain-containing protein, partial [Micrococcaceae bacterium]